jgi:beta-xylosidase
MIEAAMLWNEPNNKSHWDPEVDPGWLRYSAMTAQTARALGAVAPGVQRVLGGISPIDASFITRLERQGALGDIDVLAVHGFPLDWNLWQIDEWPAKLAEIRAVSSRPIWVTEVGASSFGAEEVQRWALARTAELLAGRTARIHWYSLYDLPREWEATTRHKEAEGSSYYRHFHMGILREDGTPKLALETFARHTPALGLCQWFHFEDHRLDDAVRWMKSLGVRKLRTGLSWSDRCRPGGLEWLDRMMESLAGFDLTVTFCFTPEHLGIQPHHTSAPRRHEDFVEFCCEMLERYAEHLPRSQPAIAVA